MGRLIHRRINAYFFITLSKLLECWLCDIFVWLFFVVFVVVVGSISYDESEDVLEGVDEGERGVLLVL